MTNYHLTPPANPLPYYEAQQKREQRRKQLEEVRARRKIISTRFHEKVKTLPPPPDQFSAC